MGYYFGYLKEVSLLQYENPPYEEAQQSINDFICFHNYERMQFKTRYTPCQLKSLPS
jgi:hypothetical protein